MARLLNRVNPRSPCFGDDPHSVRSLPFAIRWTVPVALAIAVLAGACASTSTGPATGGAMLSFSALRDEAVIQIRLSERAAVHEANRCMRQQGFQAPGVDLSGPLSPGIAPELPPLTETADSIGYNRPVEDVERPETDFDRYFASLSDAERFEWGFAYFGADDASASIELPGGMVLSVPDEGCLAEARRFVRGVDEARTQGLLMRIQALAVDVKALVESDSAVQAAAEHWRRCMARESFSFEDPFDAIDYAFSTRSVRDPTPSLIEVEIAVADKDCRDMSGYTSSRDDATRRSEAQVLSENEALVLEWKEVESLIRQRNHELLPASATDLAGSS